MRTADHGDGTEHEHLHDHDHSEGLHDEVGTTQNFARGARETEGHAHVHSHNHMGAGHHQHAHGHDHESRAHMVSHRPENLLPGGGTGGDAGQLASVSPALLAELAADADAGPGGYLRAGSAYEQAGVGAAIDAQTYDAAAVFEQDAADAAHAADLATRGHRVKAEDRLAHLMDRARLGTLSATPSQEDWDQAVLAEAGQEWAELTPDDVAAAREAGVMSAIVTGFWASHRGSARGGRGASVTRTPTTPTPRSPA